MKNFYHHSQIFLTSMLHLFTAMLRTPPERHLHVVMPAWTAEAPRHSHVLTYAQSAGFARQIYHLELMTTKMRDKRRGRRRKEFEKAQETAAQRSNKVKSHLRSSKIFRKQGGL